MKKLIVLLFSILLLVVQVSITPAIKLGWNNYQLVLLGVISVSLLFDLKFSVINAFICGVLLDSVGSLYSGVYTISFLLIVAVVALSAHFFLKRNVSSALILSFFITLLFELCMYWIFFVSRGMINHAFVVSKIILPQVFINTACALIVFHLYALLFKILNRKKKGWNHDKI